jgi:hypothetical protein
MTIQLAFSRPVRFTIQVHISFIEFFNLHSVNCHAEYKLVGRYEIAGKFRSQIRVFVSTIIFTSERNERVKIVLRNKYVVLLLK